MTAQEVIGTPVIDTDSGAQWGVIDRLLLEHPGRIAYVIVRPSAWHLAPVALRAESVHLGCPLLASPSQGQALAERPDILACHGIPFGLPVLALDGGRLGRVDDLLLHEDGQVEGFRLDSGLPLDPAFVRAMGVDAVVVQSLQEDAPPPEATVTQPHDSVPAQAAEPGLGSELVGRVVQQDVLDDDGQVFLPAGQTISLATVETAQQRGLLVALAMVSQPV